MRHIGTGTYQTTPRIRKYVDEVLDSGRISYGEKSKAFEKLFAQEHDSRYAILSNSGTSALQVALQAMKELHGWNDGDEVIVPATTFVATANIVIHNRLTPVFIDIEDRSYGMDTQLFLNAITDKTRAVIPVHLFGQPCDIEDILIGADENGIALIEDSCETMFVKVNNKPVGAWGDIGCFSTYVAHLLVTGVGGLSITDNPDYAAKMRSLVNHGLQIDQLDVDDNFSPRPMTGREFRFESHGHSYRITEFEAALGLAQLEDLIESRYKMLKTRRKNARHISAQLKIINGYTDDMFKIPGEVHEHAWMMYPIVIQSKKFAKRQLTDFLNANGVETRDFMPILRQPVYAYLNDEDYPVAANTAYNGFYVGCHQDLTTEDIRYMTDLFHQFAEKHK